MVIAVRLTPVIKVARQRSNEFDQHYRSNESESDASEAVRSTYGEQQAKEQAADKCADNAKDDVDDQPGPAPLHHPPSEPHCCHTYQRPGACNQISCPCEPRQPCQHTLR